MGLNCGFYTREEVLAEVSEFSDEFSVKTTKNPHSGDRFIRFMGADEFYALLRGDELVSERQHALTHRTNSQGFCFLRIGDEWSAEQQIYDEFKATEFAYEFLSGIVDDFVAVVFENESQLLKKGYGIYADPYGSSWDFYPATMWVDEYSTTHYDKRAMVPKMAYMWLGWNMEDVETIEF